MKKIYRSLAVLLAALTLVFSLAGCGNAYESPYEDYEYDGGHAETVGTAPEARTEAVTEPEETAGSETETSYETTAAEETEAETTAAALPEAEPQETTAKEKYVPEYGEYYYDVENVVLYLIEYGELPPNYITKDEARDLGWDGGSVEDYKDGAAIGGDRFGNYEGQLPEKKGVKYTECDIDTDGYYSRGSRRLVYSNDGHFYYTGDHYETFKEVFVDENNKVMIED